MKIVRLAIVAAWLSMSTSAYAQAVPPRLGVDDRKRPDYEPIGGRIGAFIIYPRLDTTATYDDNIFASTSDTGGGVEATPPRESDLILNLRPAVRVESQWSQHGLLTEGYLAQSVHASNSGEDTTQYGGKIVSSINASRQLTIRMTGSADHLAIDRSDYNDVPDARSPIEYERFSGNLFVNYDFAQVSLFAEGGIVRTNYFSGTSRTTGGVIDQNFRDVKGISGTLGARVRLRAGPSLITRVTFDDRKYDFGPGSPGFVDGVDRIRDSKGIKAVAGFSFDVTSLILGEVTVGYLHRSYDDPNFDDTSGLSFGADLLWNVTPLSSVRLAVDRSFEDTRSTLTAGNLRTEGRLSVDHELLRNLILSAAGRYAVIDPNGPLGNSYEYGGDLGARYLLNRRFEVDLGYRLVARRGSTVGRRFDANRLSVTLRTAL